MAAKKPTTCPLNEDYRFFGRCRIKSCKNQTSLTKRGCIALDHIYPGGEKVISDAELMVYKFRGEASSVRSVGSKRKRATTYVRQYILFYYFIQFIRERFASPTIFYYSEGIEPLVDNILALKPMKRERLAFKPWMLPHVMNPTLQDEFRLTFGCSDSIDLLTLFQLKPKEFEKMKAAVKHMQTTNTLF